MAINFQKLPTKNPGNELLAKDKYHAIIKSAEMKTSQADTEYLNLGLELYNKDNKKIGFVYDILSESDKPIAQYKLQRFIVANGLEKELLAMTIELKDLGKLVVGHHLWVDIGVEKGKNGYSDKNNVDAFADEIYAAYTTATEETANPKADTDETDLDSPF